MRRRIMRWRAAVSAAVAKGVAQTFHEAFLGETGRPVPKAPRTLNLAAPTGSSAAVRSAADAADEALRRQEVRAERQQERQWADRRGR